MSKILLRDDDVIEIMDELYKLVEMDDSSADYVFDKLCTASGRNTQEYYKTLKEIEERAKK